jgi:hypothetical protein
MQDRKGDSSVAGASRREVVKKLVYAAPIVVSLAASPAFASSGSPGGDSPPPCHGKSTPGAHGSHLNN